MVAMDIRTDKQLIEQYKNGECAALDALVERYLGTAYRFARNLVGNEADAEDVVQNSFLKVWKKIGSFNAEKPFRPWLSAVVRNTALDFLRKRKETPFSTLDFDDGDRFEDSVADVMPLADERLELAFQNNRVASLLPCLSREQRAVLTLRYAEEMTFQAISEKLGASLDTVKSRHRRALLKLRTLLGQAPKPTSFS